jgi:DNA polymerase I-like protein with 3'-5' exonuclease and polymerase domains
MEGEIPTGLNAFTNYQAYNILDSAVTAQLTPVMKARLNDNTRITYEREMRLQSLCLEMSTKGFPIDQFCLAELLWQLEKDEARALLCLHKFCEAVNFRPVNPNSKKDVPELFYQHFGIPPIYNYDRKTRERKITVDEKALEKIRGNYPIALPFVNAILAAREARKMGSVFKRGLEPATGALRCQFSPSGTETGRLSSQQNPYGRGTNAQNLTDRVRQGITAPDGYAILNLDLKTAESSAVGYLSGCVAYINACLSGDVHTAGCRIVWPELPWTGNIALDKDIAEQVFYRWFTYRDFMKKGGHGTNYYGTPPTLQKVAFASQVTIAFVEEFQTKYFGGFPEIKEWQLSTIAEIQQVGTLVTPLHRERRFWGRPDDAATHREAIAFRPQSLVADVMNEGLMQVQAWLLRNCREGKTFLGRNGRLLPFRPTVADLRAQVHDAGVFLVPLDGLAELAPAVQKQLEYPVDFGNLGTMLIPSDMSVGKRWNKAPKKNATQYTAEGLKSWKPGQPLHWKA